MKETDRSADTRHKKNPYDDILHLPRHVSKVHPRMSRQDRAAQFSPFAALTGHGEAIRETARLTQERMELDENSRLLLDEKLRTLQAQAGQHPKVTITYFQQDPKKAGGAYVEASGSIKRIDQVERMLLLCDGEKIPLDDIIEIEQGV